MCYSPSRFMSLDHKTSRFVLSIPDLSAILILPMDVTTHHMACYGLPAPTVLRHDPASVSCLGDAVDRSMAHPSITRHCAIIHVPPWLYPTIFRGMPFFHANITHHSLHHNEPMAMTASCLPVTMRHSAAPRQHPQTPPRLLYGAIPLARTRHLAAHQLFYFALPRGPSAAVSLICACALMIPKAACAMPPPPWPAE